MKEENKTLVAKVSSPISEKGYGFFGLDFTKFINPNFYIDQYILKYALALLNKLPSGFITILGITIVLMDQFMPACVGQYCVLGQQVLDFLHKLPITETGSAIASAGLVKKSFRIGSGVVEVNGLPPAKQ